jgi:hypothetical protein
VTCTRCGAAAEFHSHREHAPHRLVGAIRHRRAYYLCRGSGHGTFPFDQQAGLTARLLTPATERVATLAGAVADSFEKGADLLEELSGIRLGESTLERTTEDAGRRLADAVEAGMALGPRADWPWPKDYEGLVCNLSPDWPWPDQKPRPMRSRSLSGPYPLEEFAPLMRPMAGRVCCCAAPLHTSLVGRPGGWCALTLRRPPR